MAKLIILRGNSGSGKTTIAKGLQKKSLDMVQCLYRKMLLEEKYYM